MEYALQSCLISFTMCLQSTCNVQDLQDVSGAGQRRLWRGVCLSGEGNGQDVCLQKVGEKEDKEAQGGSYGAHRKANPTKNKFQICRKYCLFSFCFCERLMM